MSIFLFILLFSFVIHFILMIPFIDFLYKIKFQRMVQQTYDIFDQKTPIFDKHNNAKAGTPVGGGILIVLVTSLLFGFFLYFFPAFGYHLSSNYPKISSEIGVIIFTFVSFAILGLYDDIAKFYASRGRPKFFGMRWRHKAIIQVILAIIIAFWLFFELKIDLINIPFLGPIPLSWVYIPFSIVTIVAFSNAVNITDGLDGLSGGTLFIALLALWAISVSILDTPNQLFIAIWLGGLMAFLYFNVCPARLWMGDTGAMSFGATFAVIGLLLGKPLALIPIGGIFVIEASSSLVQILSKKFWGRKLFQASPLHLFLQYHGWEESKIVMRMWIFGAIFALFGLMIAFIK